MTGTDFHFRAYGLSVRSDFQVVEAEAITPCQADLTIRHVAVSRSVFRFSDFRNYRITPDGDVIEYRGVGGFLVRNPGLIDVDVEAGFDQRLIGMPLLGPVFSLLLHRKGLLVLHGSAVMIGGVAHVFLGDKGAGKSTTAAALIAAGYPLISDDVIAIEKLPSGKLAIWPGYPAMKLDRTMLAAWASGSYNVLAPDDGAYTGGKTRIRLKNSMPPEAVPLGTVHCLARGRENAVAPLNQVEKLHRLIRFSHYPRLGQAANAPSETARLFARAAALVPDIDMDVLTVKDSLAEISEIGSFLQAQAESIHAFA
jgi:hypothetical protein